MLSLALTALLPAAVAFSQLRLEEGTALRWTEDNPWVDAPYIPLAGNTRNSAGVLPEVLQPAVVRGLQRWQAASGGAFSFDYWQGDNPEVYALGQVQDGLSTISFASAAPDSAGALDGTVAAHTQVWYAPGTDTITEVDIILNDLWFGFTDEPLEASYGEGGLLGQTLYLDDVITHELGHALGLGHSGVLRSSMFPQSWADQSHLSCDDVAAIRSVYTSEQASGQVTGRVLQPDGAPVFGAQVTAFSRETEGGVASLSAAMTETDGSYTLEGLAPGTWYLVVEPVYEEESLSAYYSGLDHASCAGLLFERSFLVGGDGRTLVPLHVAAGTSQLAPDVSVVCAGEEGEAAGAGGDLPDALPVVEGAIDFALVDTVELAGSARWYRLDDVEGTLAVELLSYSLFSPAWIRPTLLNAEGDPVADVLVDEPRYEDQESGYTLWDSRLTVALPERGTYYLSLEAERLSDALYPSPSPIDTRPFVVVLGGFPDPLAAEGVLDCAMEEDYGDYESPPGDPLRWQTLQSLAETAPTGCAAAPAPAGVLGLLLSLLGLRWREPPGRPPGAPRRGTRGGAPRG